MTDRPVFVPLPEVPVGGGQAVDPLPPPRIAPVLTPEEEARMTLIEHLEELRRVLIVSLSAWGIGTVVGTVLSDYVITLLSRPLLFLHLKPVYFSPMGYFSVHLKVGLAVGLVLSLPVLLQQVWSFVAPGLKPAEKRFAGPLLVSSLGLFAAGAGLAYFFLYIAVRIIDAVSHGSLTYLPEINSYLGFILLLMLAFGITFEFPVALVLLSLTGLVSSAKLRRWRKGAILVIAAVGYVVTPGVDPVTPLALIVPLLFLYEASILIIRRLGH